MNSTLVITENHHSIAMKHLFPGDGLEAAAIGLCSLVTSGDRERVLIHKIYPIPYDQCIRNEDLLSWNSTCIIEILNEADRLGLSIIKLHSHPGFYDEFSIQDDKADKTIFPSFYEWIDDVKKHFSAIFLPDGSIVFRHVSQDGKFTPGNRTCLIGDQIKITDRSSSSEFVTAPELKIISAFGVTAHSNMKKIKVVVVGNSGTGSIVIEGLKRHMIGEMVLIDPDRIELKNLNRIIGATYDDAINKRFKVDVMKREIEKVGFGTKVKTFKCDLMNNEAIREISTADVIFGCMDSIRGRHLLNLIATYYLLPYFDVGVSIHATGTGDISQAVLGTNYLQPSLSTLFSRGIYNTDALEADMLKNENPSEYEERLKEGYVKGVRIEQPAVFSLNNLAAAFCFEDFMARFNSYRFDPDTSSQRIFSLLHDEYLPKKERDFKPFDSWKPKTGLGNKFFKYESHRFQNERLRAVTQSTACLTGKID